MEDFTYLIDISQPIDVIYLHFQKAFDHVRQQQLLLYKLNSHGFTGNIINFLYNMIQKVRVGNQYSMHANVLSGVPPGIILGPVLCTAFIYKIMTFQQDYRSCNQSFAATSPARCMPYGD